MFGIYVVYIVSGIVRRIMRSRGETASKEERSNRSVNGINEV